MEHAHAQVSRDGLKQVEVLAFLKCVRGVNASLPRDEVERDGRLSAWTSAGGDIRRCHLQGNAKASQFGTHTGIGRTMASGLACVGLIRAGWCRFV